MPSLVVAIPKGADGVISGQDDAPRTMSGFLIHSMAREHRRFLRSEAGGLDRIHETTPTDGE